MSHGLAAILGGRSPEARLSQPSVLVVDDESEIRAHLCEGLITQGAYCCTAVASPGDALDISRSDTTDVVVLALTKPADASLKLARQLRKAVPDLPVVLLTSARSFDVAVEAMRIGIFDYLLKPFEMSELIDAVERAAVWRGAALHARKYPDDLMRQVAERTAGLSKAFSKYTGTSSAELQAVLETQNQRNPETLDHARRVAQLAMRLAAALDLQQPVIEVIEQGALLHDLGKIAIPDDVIHKHGPLTAAELAVMRSHVQIGHDIAATVPSLRDAAELVLATHERYDGTGYPRGLRGEQIPLGARVIATVDAFDALTSARVYRDPASTERANAELVRGAGSQFDPGVVGAWLRCMDRTTAPDGVADAAEIRSQRA